MILKYFYHSKYTKHRKFLKFIVLYFSFHLDLTFV